MRKPHDVGMSERGPNEVVLRPSPFDHPQRVRDHLLARATDANASSRGRFKIIFGEYSGKTCESRKGRIDCSSLVRNNYIYQAGGGCGGSRNQYSIEWRLSPPSKLTPG